MMRSIFRTALVSMVGVALGGVAGVLSSSPAVADDDALGKRADKIAKKVAKLRGLRQKKPIKRGVMKRPEIRKRLIERVDQEYTPEELQAEELSLKRLGLLAPDAKFKQLVIDAFTEQIAGFYDPIDQTLYIADGMQSDSHGFSDILMAHEIDHALQDQHFGLRAFMKPKKHKADAGIARQALVEGDGTALMFEFMMLEMGMDMPWADSRTTDAMTKKMAEAMVASGQMNKIPLVLREGMVFPYMAGLAFVSHFRKHHPWKRIDQMYKKPPLSTEHILHPETYERYERPDEIKVGAIGALSDYTKAYDDVIGEQGLSIVLRQHAGVPMQKRGDVYAPVEKAARAAAGWGGDRFAIYTPPEHSGGVHGTIGVVYTVWDEVADAIEFFDMLSDSMSGISGGKENQATDDRVLFQRADGSEFLAQRKDSTVLLVLEAPKDKADVILEQVWKTWKVRRR